MINGNKNYIVTEDGCIISFERNRIKCLSQLVSTDGYLMVGLKKYKNKKTFSVHRLVWQMFRGKIPKKMQIHHIDHDKLNNNIKNLKLVTNQQNQLYNTDYPGAHFYKGKNLWLSYIRVNGKKKLLGSYSTRTAASKRFLKEYKKIYGVKL